MISDLAARGFDEMLQRSLRSLWVGLPDEAADVRVLSTSERPPEGHAVMLSVSSYCVRLVVMLHYDLDMPTRRHFATATNRELSEMDDQALRDAVAESCNLMCGALNRQINNVFPHLGMSTPRHLPGDCALYLDALGAKHTSRVQILLSDGLHVQVTLAASAYAPVDFAIEDDAQPECVGELELF